MENWWKCLAPEDMTPAERLTRVVELLAAAALRLIEEPPTQVEEAGPHPAPVVFRPRGRVAFGKRWELEGWKDDPIEAAWIGRIVAWAKEGLSSEKIARRLNVEDRETRRAGKWSRPMVWRILRREKRRGATD